MRKDLFHHLSNLLFYYKRSALQEDYKRIALVKFSLKTCLKLPIFFPILSISKLMIDSIDSNLKLPRYISLSCIIKSFAINLQRHCKILYVNVKYYNTRVYSRLMIYIYTK